MHSITSMMYQSFSLFKKEVLVPSGDQEKKKPNPLARLIDEKLKMSSANSGSEPSLSSARHHKQFLSDLVKVIYLLNVHNMSD